MASAFLSATSSRNKRLQKHFTAWAINFQDPFNTELWDRYVKSSDLVPGAEDDQLLAESGSQEDTSLDPRMSCNQDPSSTASSSSSSLLEDIVTRTKTVALHKLTNLEFWIRHLDSIFTEDCIVRAAGDGWADPELSRSLIEEFLQIMNAHLSKTYPTTFLDINKKNFFPKLADVLSKHLPILFGDYLPKDDVQNTNTTPPSPPFFSRADPVTETETAASNAHPDEDYPPASVRSHDTSLQEFVRRLRLQRHGRHRVEVQTDSKGSPVISCDGFYFRPRGAVTRAPNQVDM